MSENHARLFASAVPGNRSSNTIAENGSDHNGETNDIQQTENVGRYTPKSPDSRRHRTTPTGEIGDDEGDHRNNGGELSPEDNDRGEQPDIKEECIEQMDNIVEVTSVTHFWVPMRYINSLI